MIETTHWDEFLRRYCDKKISEVIHSGKKSLEISYGDIFKFDSDSAKRLIDEPEEVLREIKEALGRYVTYVEADLQKLHVRITEVDNKKLIRDIRSEDIGKFIAVEGLVRKVTEVRPRLVEASFLCEKCGSVIRIEQNGSKLITPQKCSNEFCNGTKFRLLPEESKFVDSQRIRIQESPEDLKGGEQPQMIDVVLEDDLSGTVAPGDKIVVNGILRAYPREGRQAKSNVFDIYIEGNSIEIKEQEFEDLEITREDYEKIMELAKDPDICEKIINSIAPSIYGYREIKEAIALQLFSGVPKILPDGSRIRGDIHILLVGDPGIAKSQLLRYVVQLAPRGIYTSGKSSTSAGLTATAVRDEFGEGRWTLEAGALVLADKGIAAVDEIDKMSPEDRSALHEAMEQQSYHPSFEIVLADGTKRRIGELVDELFERFPERIIRGVNCEILRTDGLNLELLTTDFREVFRTKADRISRHAAPENFVRIRYSNGSEILVTPEHPVFVMKNGEISTVEAREVEKGVSVPGFDEAERRIIELKVEEVEILPNQGELRTEWVYDVTVEPTHTFISHGLVLHNTVSVAKAGITATLKTRCSLLAAANPKSGRFDPHEMIATQINMPPTLLSRFDLIFPMMDTPSKERDEMIARHILSVHYAGELDAIKRNFVASRIREDDVEEAMKVIQPPIEPSLLRKYIAYARRTIFPVLSEEARKRLEEYYVGLRRQAESGDAPIPITARQLEALIRLSEASARMRMSEVVEIEDVERVIRIMEGCLRKVGIDPETGRMDIDTITTGVTKSQRDRIKMIIDIIKELEGEEGARESDVLERAEELGIPKHRAAEIISNLIRNGEITTPRYGYLRLVTRY
ncbi:MAG: AAA family ATPase [Archaeoglobi archaeon]|nr:AAA family ATPase [Candidatus Mnemosynella bozhongmuii]